MGTLPTRVGEMWVIGILSILIGLEMVLQGERSGSIRSMIQHREEMYENFFDSDVMQDLLSLSLFLFPWPFVWIALREHVSFPLRTGVCLLGAVGTTCLWARVRRHVRSYVHPCYHMELLRSRRFVQGVGCMYILMGILCIVLG